MCMTFGCNPQKKNVTFFSLNFVVFWLKLLPMRIDTGYLVNTTLQFYADLFETLQVFCQSLKMYMRFGCNMK